MKRCDECSESVFVRDGLLFGFHTGKEHVCAGLAKARAAYQRGRADMLREICEYVEGEWDLPSPRNLAGVLLDKFGKESAG